jgi:hypothetical protein
MYRIDGRGRHCLLCNLIVIQLETLFHRCIVHGDEGKYQRRAYTVGSGECNEPK